MSTLKKIPSVTEILQPWEDFTNIPAAVLMMAADRGSRVHRACGDFLRGFLGPYTPVIGHYLDSFKGWFNSTVDELLDFEYCLESTAHGFHGRPDMLVIIKGDSNPTLVEIKTPAVFNPLWRVQLAGYKILHMENKITLDRALVLRLNKHGKSPIVTECTNSLIQDVGGFMKALNSYKYFTSLKERLI